MPQKAYIKWTSPLFEHFAGPSSGSPFPLGISRGLVGSGKRRVRLGLILLCLDLFQGGFLPASQLCWRGRHFDSDKLSGVEKRTRLGWETLTDEERPNS